MDKYTVDLDKVLNDFEYSELTEQTEARPAAAPAQPYASHSSRNDGPIKHSMNNVFSSLNEYLNTEINQRNNFQISDLQCTNSAKNVTSHPKHTDVANQRDLENETIGYNDFETKSSRNETVGNNSFNVKCETISDIEIGSGITDFDGNNESSRIHEIESESDRNQTTNDFVITTEKKETITINDLEVKSERKRTTEVKNYSHPNEINETTAINNVEVGKTNVNESSDEPNRNGILSSLQNKRGEEEYMIKSDKQKNNEETGDITLSKSEANIAYDEAVDGQNSNNGGRSKHEKSLNKEKNDEKENIECQNSKRSNQNNNVSKILDIEGNDEDVEKILDELERKIENEDKKILREFERKMQNELGNDLNNSERKFNQSENINRDFSENNVAKSEQAVIGFENTMDIDEAELHKYLDDLELELEEKHGTPNNTSTKSPNVSDSLVSVIKNDITNKTEKVKNTNELNSVSSSKVNNDVKVNKNSTVCSKADSLNSTENMKSNNVMSDEIPVHNKIDLRLENGSDKKKLNCEIGQKPITDSETKSTSTANLKPEGNVTDISSNTAIDISKHTINAPGNHGDIQELSAEITKLKISNPNSSDEVSDISCELNSDEPNTINKNLSSEVNSNVSKDSGDGRNLDSDTRNVPKINRDLKPKSSDILKLDGDIPKLTIKEDAQKNVIAKSTISESNTNIAILCKNEVEKVDISCKNDVSNEIDISPCDELIENVNISGEREVIDDVGISDETDSDDVKEAIGKIEINANSGEEGGSGNSELDTYETCSENICVETSLKRNSPEDSVTSPSERPSSLDINGQGDGKREINLIGNPGSTPYNNLYVTKEISVDKTKTQANSNYESESSASVSPTFSEASTDSVRSTDSTDSEPENAKGTANEEGTSTHEADTQENVVAGSSAIENSSSTGQSMEEDVYMDAENTGTGNEMTQSEISEDDIWLGKRAPLWIQDAEALNCLHCGMKFTIIKRRHHCRACGFVLCSKCCNLKHRLEYLDSEARVCTKCHVILTRDSNSSSGSEISPATGNSPARQSGRPNPNNPMEYCSVVPPLQQVSNAAADAPPTVMVPVGVLKRKGSNKAKHNKSVMFCDGIRPGSDLTNLDNDFNYNETKSSSSSSSSSSSTSTSKKQPNPAPKVNRNMPVIDSTTKSFIPENDSCLPPTVTQCKTDITYTECANNANVVEMLKNEMLTFAMQPNLHVHVRLITMDCCINKQAWCFSTEGMINVGQDEIVILLEYIDNEKIVPKDILYHLSHIYNEAVKGNTVTELGLSLHPTTNFLDSKNHAGFIYIRPTFQCLQKLIIPKEPYLFGILVHRWETPWAKIFPLRLVLRLGAEYRYYPSPIISTRHRDSVFVEIGHTIINLLADFRNFTYTLPNIRGLTIHMEGKNTTVTIPVNRYEQVMKSLSNSSDHILAFGGNFSENTDSHLVCIQDTHGNNENNYTTHAINIQNKPRQVTGASFIVFNGALKSSSGLTAKSSIVEDGLMIQIPPDQMVQVRESLRNMKNHTIQCGCVNAASDETVNIIWGDPDTNFNIGVKSCIDEQSLSGVPSIRVHNGKDYVCSSGKRFIRWTEVFLMQNGEENARTQDPVDVSKVAESISKATCQALVNYLDLLAKNNSYKIGIRTTLHVDSVSYSAGSNGTKLAPLYMNSLDNELIPVLHRITSNSIGDSAIILELIFRILNA